jgi:hypothetical protein
VEQSLLNRIGPLGNEIIFLLDTPILFEDIVENNVKDII